MFAYTVTKVKANSQMHNFDFDKNLTNGNTFVFRVYSFVHVWGVKNETRRDAPTEVQNVCSNVKILICNLCDTLRQLFYIV